MAKMYEIEGKDISTQAQKIIKSLKPNASTDDKANAALALSVLALLSHRDRTLYLPAVSKIRQRPSEVAISSSLPALEQ